MEVSVEHLELVIVKDPFVVVYDSGFNIFFSLI